MNLKNLIKGLFLLPLAAIFFMTSCQNEVAKVTDVSNEQELLVANSRLTTLLSNAVSENDFIGGDCFEVNLPIRLIANGTEVVVEEKGDYRELRDIFNEPNTDDTLEIVFPISIELLNGEIEVNSQGELDAIIAKCVLSDDSDEIDIHRGGDCFEVNLPIRLIANGIEVVVEENGDYRELSDVFNESDTDDDTLEIVFPIILELLNGEIEVNSQGELDVERAKCALSDEEDERCIRFNYPLTGTYFNSSFQLIYTNTILNDRNFADFLEMLEDPNIILGLNFPIALVLEDGSTMEVNSNDELFQVLEACE